MKITLLTVGKTNVEWVKEGLDLYSSRLVHYVKFSVTEIPDLRNTASLSKDQIKEKEGELILKHLKSDETVILLDERGQELRSVQFSLSLEEKMNAGKDIVFVIGGPYGFSDAVYARCNGKIALSKMTFPHQLVRTIFAEQLYRAFTIMKGEPYHHE